MLRRVPRIMPRRVIIMKAKKIVRKSKNNTVAVAILKQSGFMLLFCGS